MTIFSSATLSPTEVLAGDSTEFVITLIVGPDYTPGSSRLIVDCPATVGMSRPTILHQEEHGYLSAALSNPQVSFCTRVWDMEIGDFPTMERGSWRGMAARMGVVDISAGLMPGDSIEIRWGDTGGGFGPGTKVTTVVPHPDYHCPIHLRYFDNAEGGLPDWGRDFEGSQRPHPQHEETLEFTVQPRTPHHLRLVRTARNALLIPHDIFWNVAPTDSLEQLVQCSEPAQKNDFNLYEFRSVNVSLRSKGLPLQQAPCMRDVFEGCSIYWGDVHNHTAYSYDCIEREKLQISPAQLMSFAKNRAGLDFYCPTDHHEPMQGPRFMIGQERWKDITEQAQLHSQPGEFVVFAGLEFRCIRGDTAIIFANYPDYQQISHQTLNDIRAFWQQYQGGDYLSIPHFHNPGRMEPQSWWDGIDSGIEPVMEIFSCHGSYERPDAFENGLPLMKSRRPDRFADWFLNKGYKYGLSANSDGHKGHVGSSGLTAVYARELTKEAIFEAYRNRNVYGTTNARIRLLFTANGALMGSVMKNQTRKQFHIAVETEGALKKVELFCNVQLHTRFAPCGTTFSQDITVNSDAPSVWYVRVTQCNNHIAWSSPVWFE
jgi:hypothetical protein